MAIQYCIDEAWRETKSSPFSVIRFIGLAQSKSGVELANVGVVQFERLAKFRYPLEVESRPGGSNITILSSLGAGTQYGARFNDRGSD